MISLIVAMAKNRTIGKGNTIPWHIPEEQARFRKITLHHTIIWGRKTYESIGRPLPHRRNIIVTRNANYEAPGCELASSLSQALELSSPSEKEIFIGGGEQLYREALPRAERIYLTIIDMEVNGDAIFPEFPMGDFSKVEEEKITGSPSYTNFLYERNS